MADLNLLDLLEADHENLVESGPLVVTFVSQHLSVERDLLLPLVRRYCEDADSLVDALLRSDRLLEERLRQFEADPASPRRASLDQAVRDHIDGQTGLFRRLRRDIPASELEAVMTSVPLTIGGSPSHGHPHLAEAGPAGEAVEDLVSVLDHLRDRVRHRPAPEGLPAAPDGSGPSPLAGRRPRREATAVEHGVDPIDRTVTKTYEWLHALASLANLEETHRSYQVLRAVLHALRDRLSPDVAAHVSAQLPLLVRGIFYEGWDPGRTPERMSLPEFLARVEKEASLKGSSEAEDAVRAVMSLLWDELGEGTMEHLMSVLPRGFAAFM